ncbi:hypothetical protein E1B28_012039 [Marasmius oreades]|uniref:Uncharacterized protein n=1 Tax=Marasmius oreades TaxID=181124 RepID=A0A9P7RRI5_9AGAR|nr:uncharacterized protein E1B28_012039 [Marasmius oreades]KAG7088000.1 hypothetical protein E1B28_012039 [Marasmius oreades]
MSAISAASPDSDIEDVSTPTYTLPVGPLSDKRVREIIDMLQQHCEQLRNNNSILRMEIGALKAQATATTRRGRKAKAAAPDAPYSRDVILLKGKQWPVMGSPWLHQDVFLRWPNPNALDPLSPDRYLNNDSYIEGTTIELHEFLGSDELCQLAVELGSFRDDFINEVNAQRSTGLNTSRTAVNNILSEFNLPSTIWLSASYPQRQNHETLSALLRAPVGTTNQNSNPFSAVFFPGQVYNMARLFMNEYQPKFLHCILFGPSSINGGKFAARNNLVGIRWNVTEVNSSAIAFSAILVQFLLSQDENLEPKGTRSNIDYWKNFMTFKQIIDNDIYIKGTYAPALFNYYNRRVFSGIRSVMRPHEDVTSQDTYGDAVAQAFQDLAVSRNPAPESVRRSESPESHDSSELSDPANETPNPTPTIYEETESDSDSSITLPANPAPPHPCTAREVHPLHSDGTEILGGEPLRTGPPQAGSTLGRGGRGRGGGGHGGRRDHNSHDKSGGGDQGASVTPDTIPTPVPEPTSTTPMPVVAAAKRQTLKRK